MVTVRLRAISASPETSAGGELRLAPDASGAPSAGGVLGPGTGGEDGRGAGAGAGASAEDRPPAATSRRNCVGAKISPSVKIVATLPMLMFLRRWVLAPAAREAPATPTPDVDWKERADSSPRAGGRLTSDRIAFERSVGPLTPGFGLGRGLPRSHGCPGISRLGQHRRRGGTPHVHPRPARRSSRTAMCRNQTALTHRRERQAVEPPPIRLQGHHQPT